MHAHCEARAEAGRDARLRARRPRRIAVRDVPAAATADQQRGHIA